MNSCGNVFYASAVTINKIFNLSAVEPSLKHAPSLFKRPKS